MYNIRLTFKQKFPFVHLVCDYLFQNVGEEKQHDWYKQMYKSLHKSEKKEGGFDVKIIYGYLVTLYNSNRSTIQCQHK